MTADFVREYVAENGKAENQQTNIDYDTACYRGCPGNNANCYSAVRRAPLFYYTFIALCQVL